MPQYAVYVALRIEKEYDISAESEEAAIAEAVSLARSEAETRDAYVTRSDEKDEDET